MEHAGRAAAAKRPVRDAVRRVRRLGRPIKYWGRRFECPVCGGRFRRLLYSPAVDFENTCPRCESTERHRHFWLYLERRTDVLSARLRLLHIAPEHCFEPRLRRLANLDYVTSELEPGRADLALDLTAGDLPAGDFDALICLHVLEHISDDAAAMRGLHQMLRPGGFALVQSPVMGERTREDPTMTSPEERERLFGQHDHVRFYGRDLRERLEEAGFAVRVETFRDELSIEERERYALRQHWMRARFGEAAEIDHDDLWSVYVCTKPA